MKQALIRFALILILIILFTRPAFAAEDLSIRLERILSNPCLKHGKVCMEVKSMNTGEVLFQKNPDQPMVPASNMKIITAAAALKTLKPWYKFDTIVSHTGERAGDTITGDLVITGRGDPHLVTEDIWSMANEVRRRGIKHIKGNILLDDGYFDGEPFPPGWRLSNIRKAYEAPTGALSLNFNTVTVGIYPYGGESSRPSVVLDPQSSYFTLVNNLTASSRGRTFVAIRLKPRNDGGEILEVIGRVRPNSRETMYYRAVAAPVSYFGLTFADLLKSSGITIGGTVIHSQPQRPTNKLFIHSSRPLIHQVMDMNKFSNNFMAEQLLKTIGAEESSSPGTVGKGISIVENLLNSWGMGNRFHLSDGSGLSKDNRLTCSLLTDVLQRMFKDREGGPEFLSSLAVMGKDGSARKRNITASNPIRVKTGTLDAVSALSGYYPLKDGEVLAFSIIFNELSCWHGMAQHVQNRLVLELETVR